MKKLLFVLLFGMLVLAACGGNEEASTPKEENTENVAAPEEEVKEEENDNDWDNQVGDVVKNDGGEFTLIARQDQIETLESGPVVLNIPQVNATSGKLKGDLVNLMGTEEVEYIQIDMAAKNTSDDTINFYPGQATITTSTGEQLKSHMMLSDHIPGEFIGPVKKSGSQFFILENSKAEDVEWVRVIIDAPKDDNHDPIGEDIDFKVEL